MFLGTGFHHNYGLFLYMIPLLICRLIWRFSNIRCSKNLLFLLKYRDANLALCDVYLTYLGSAILIVYCISMSTMGREKILPSCMSYHGYVVGGQKHVMIRRLFENIFLNELSAFFVSKLMVHFNKT